MLSDRTIVPHATFVSGANGITHQAPDLEILRDHSVSIAHCPLVMARHGAAMQSFAKYRNMGINIGMGTDTHPPDMIMNMQIGLMTARLTGADPFETRSEDMFNAATLGGADALKRPDLGRLQAGACADLIVIGLDDPAMGQVIDPIQTLMLNGSGRDVRTVVIDGRFVMTEGVIPGVDDDAMRRQAQAQFDGMVVQYPDRTHMHPPVEEIFSASYPIVRHPND
jgi:cytosine/adenosine deaminase-related metal-dependent hydrolase